MKIGKKMSSCVFGIASLMSLLICADCTVKKKRKKKKKPKMFEIDDDIQWVLDCLDEMIIDLKQMYNQQDSQEKRLAQVEVRIDNVNSRMDSFLGGK